MKLSSEHINFAFGMALLTMGYQSTKAATANPCYVCENEYLKSSYLA
jgi:hypothetical protein